MGKSYMRMTAETGDISYIRKGIQHYTDRFSEIINEAENGEDGVILVAALNAVLVSVEGRMSEREKELARLTTETTLECMTVISVRKPK